MATKKTVIQRVPKEIIDDLNKAMDWRFKNNLISRKDFKLSEGFRLIRRTPEWNIALEKVKKYPKKEDI
jgi:hypothetical protein